MRIAIPIYAGKLSPHFGHSEAFALIDVDNGEITGSNYVASPPHQPGLLPRWLQEHGANVIIAGGMGVRARQLFTEKNIEVVIGAPNTEPEVIVADYVNGNLQTEGNPCDHGDGHGDGRRHGVDGNCSKH